MVLGIYWEFFWRYSILIGFWNGQENKYAGIEEWVDAFWVILQPRNNHKSHKNCRYITEHFVVYKCLQ